CGAPVQLRRSSPQSNLFLRVFKKLSESYSIIRMPNLDLDIFISIPLGRSEIRESKEIKWVLSRPDTLRRIWVSSAMTRGRALRLCGAIGVRTRDWAVGAMTGPPQLRE